ncbi:MAG: SDR family oxidoreductase [Bacteroidia bacterium]
MSAKILVTGATGTIGKAVVSALAEKGAAFVAGVRNEAEAATKLPEGTPTAAFDFTNPLTFETATAGVDRVFLLGPPLTHNLDELLTPFIDFLKTKNILRVVYVSALKIDELAELPFHKRVTEKLIAGGFELTVIKPSFFAQNFRNYEYDNIMQRGITYTVAGTGKVGFVDAHDIGRSIAAVLTSDGHTGKTYELTGPETLSHAQAAQLLTEVTGKTIVYPQPSPADYRAAFAAAGAPGFVADYMISVYSIIADHKIDYVTNHVEQLTGRKPSSLRDVLVRDFMPN